MLSPTPKNKQETPTYQRGNCAGNWKSLQQMECSNSDLEDKNVYVRVKECNIPLDAVCDTGASVSSLGSEVFDLFHVKIQSSLKPCSKRFLAANRCKIQVKSEI